MGLAIFRLTGSLPVVPILSIYVILCVRGYMQNESAPPLGVLTWA